jgi:hypothetical protein
MSSQLRKALTAIFLMAFVSLSGQSSFEHGLGVQAGMLNHYHPILVNGNAFHVTNFLSAEISYQLKFNMSQAFAISAYPAAGIVSSVVSPFNELTGGHYHLPLVAEFSPAIREKRTLVLGAGLSVLGFSGGGFKWRTFIMPQLAVGLKFPAESQRFNFRLALGLSNITSKEQEGTTVAYRDRYLNTTLACYYRFGK